MQVTGFTKILLGATLAVLVMAPQVARADDVDMVYTELELKETAEYFISIGVPPSQVIAALASLAASNPSVPAGTAPVRASAEAKPADASGEY